MNDKPALSIVLVTDQYDTVRGVVEHLRAQAARDRLELVLVVPAGGAPPAEEFAGFAATRILEVESLASLSAARAAGVHAASAPLVFVGETHSYPAAGCLEALISAHEGPWTAVVPAIENANPDGVLSWAALVLDYGRWLDGDRREVEYLPAHNLAFKREPLLDLGPRLPELLEPGTDPAARLRAQGHRFLLEPAARVQHLNTSLPGPWLRERYMFGRLTASRRSAGWSWARRLLYSAGSPLLPFLLLWRIAREVRPGSRRLHPLLYPALGLGAAVWAAGELLGYALGRDERREQALVDYELHKGAYAREPAGRAR